MKKLFLLLFIGLSIASYSQRLTWTVDVSTMGTDTTIYWKYSGDRVFNVEFIYTGLAGTSGTVDVLASNTDSTLASVSSSLPYTVTTSSTSHIFIDNPYGSKYIAFKITKGTLSAGTIEILFNYN